MHLFFWLERKRKRREMGSKFGNGSWLSLCRERGQDTVEKMRREKKRQEREVEGKELEGLFPPGTSLFLSLIKITTRRHRLRRAIRAQPLEITVVCSCCWGGDYVFCLLFLFLLGYFVFFFFFLTRSFCFCVFSSLSSLSFSLSLSLPKPFFLSSPLSPLAVDRRD